MEKQTQLSILYLYNSICFSRPEIHIKLEPRCRNVTKQDCVTKWELNAQGRKIWAGNEECREERTDS